MDNYKEKIRKLLALAESNNEHEAKSALLKARRLMAQYKIEEIDLADVKRREVKRIVTEYKYTKQGEWWIGAMANIIAENYCCRYAVSKVARGREGTVLFVGLDGDVDLCATVFGYAVDSARSLAKVRAKEDEYYSCYSQTEKKQARNSYAIGFVKGVKEALEKQNQDKEAEWGLIMVVPAEVNEACSDFRTDKYQVKRKRTFSSCLNRGYEDGVKFNPNGKLTRKD